MNKEDLRNKLKLERRAIRQADVLSKSDAITSKLIEHFDWSNVRSAHIYSSVADWHEVDTVELIKKLTDYWPKIRVVSPSIDRDNLIPREEFDVIVVPVLGFDAQRNRLGLGGGWYDKFLVIQPDAIKVGLAYQSALIEGGVPKEDHDIPLDKIIT